MSEGRHVAETQRGPNAVAGESCLAANLRELVCSVVTPWRRVRTKAASALVAVRPARRARLPRTRAACGYPRKATSIRARGRAAGRWRTFVGRVAGAAGARAPP